MSPPPESATADALRAHAPPALLLAAVLGSVYSVSQFSRNAIGVVAPDLARDLALSAAEIGFLSSIFFLTFAAAQIPLGVVVDRHGPKRVMLACGALTVVGVLVFCLAPTYAGLVAGRALLGLGCSSFLIAPLVIYARLYPPGLYSTLAGVHLALGNVGTLAATAPLAFAAASLGWRGAFSLVAAATLAAMAAVAWFVAADRFFVRPAPARDGARLGEVVRTRFFWRMMLLHITTYPTFAAIAGLWGGPWLADVYGLDLDARGLTLFVLVACHVFGLFVWGVIDRRVGSYRKPALIAGALVVACLLLAAAMPLPFAAVPVWLALFGFGLGYAPLMMAHARMLFPPEMLGRGLTLLNAGNMAGAFAIQALTGLAVDAFPRAANGAYPPAAYAAVMAILGALLAIALLAYWRVADLHPSRAPDDEAPKKSAKPHLRAS